MKKVLSVFFTVLFAAAAVFGVGAFIYTRRQYEQKAAEKTVPFSVSGSAYTSCVVAPAGEKILLPSPIDGLFYSPSPDGTVSFFTVDDGGFSPLTDGITKVRYTLPLDGEEITPTLSLVRRNGKLFGYGIWLDPSPDAVYPFAFLRLSVMPASFGKGLLLLADFDSAELYKPDKIYSELFSAGEKGGKAQPLVSDNTRLIGLDGAPRNDWSLLTDGFVDTVVKSKLFLSSRYYGLDARGVTSDLMKLSKAKLPEKAAEGVLGTWVRETEKGVLFLRKDGNGFDGVLLSGGKEKLLYKCEKDFASLLIDGSFAFDPADGGLINLLTGEISKSGVSANLDGAELFAAGPDGGKIAVGVGSGSGDAAKPQRLILRDILAKSETVFDEPMLFEPSVPFYFLDNNRLCHARALSEDGASYGSVIYSFEQNKTPRSTAAE